MSGRLTIWIDGREALPVRAIPYVAGWQHLYSPDVLAGSLARAIAAPFGKLRNLYAYHRQEGKPLTVMANEWRAVTAKIKGFVAELHEQRPDVDADHDDAGYAEWCKVAALELPAGMFVWLDEFLREREVDREFEPDNEPVTFAPWVDADTRAALLEGFEDCPRRGSDADRAMIGYADFVAICQVDDLANFGGFHVKANGLYVDLPPADEDDDPHDKLALPLPCTLGELRAFLPDAGMTGHIDEETVDALLGEREHMTGRYDATLDADMWFGLGSPTPSEAAMLLCQLDPHDDACDPTSITTDETGPKDFKRLLRVFEDEEKAEQKPRTLRQWLTIARDKGLKYHSWIDAYALAQGVELPADAGSKSEAVKVDAGAMPAIDEPKTKNWILRIQTEAARRWKALRDAGANPTKNNIKNDLATWCKETNVLTDGDINPNAEYIYRHVLSKWTPPKG